MSRVDEFAGTSQLITRIEWRDGDGTSWDAFAIDPTDNTLRSTTVSGPAGRTAVAEVHHNDGTTTVYIVKVGDKVIWDSDRKTYTFPR